MGERWISAGTLQLLRCRSSRELPVGHGDTRAEAALPVRIFSHRLNCYLIHPYLCLHQRQQNNPQQRLAICNHDQNSMRFQPLPSNLLCIISRFPTCHLSRMLVLRVLLGSLALGITPNGDLFSGCLLVLDLWLHDGSVYSSISVSR